MLFSTRTGGPPWNTIHSTTRTTMIHRATTARYRPIISRQIQPKKRNRGFLVSLI